VFCTAVLIGAFNLDLKMMVLIQDPERRRSVGVIGQSHLVSYRGQINFAG
jgi:hypothetical protein